MKRGKLIVLEGGEGSGKSTQAGILVRRMNAEGRRTTGTQEPGATPLGRYLRAYLKGQMPLTKKAELLLFEAARAELITSYIVPQLNAGTHIVCDRFAGSTIAYQGHGRNLPLDAIEWLNNFTTEGLTADLTLLLDLDPVEGMRRAGKPQLEMELGGENKAEDKGPGRADLEGHRRFEDQPLGFHQRVTKAYRQLAAKDSSWTKIDGTLSEEAVSDAIWQQVRDMAPPQRGTDTETPAAQGPLFEQETTRT